MAFLFCSFCAVLLWFFFHICTFFCRFSVSASFLHLQSLLFCSVCPVGLRTAVMYIKDPQKWQNCDGRTRCPNSRQLVWRAKVPENDDSSELHHVQMNSNARCLPLTRFGLSPIACSLFCSSSSVWGRSRNTLWMKSHCLNPRIDSSHHPLGCSSARLQAALWQAKAAQS